MKNIVRFFSFVILFVFASLCSTNAQVINGIEYTIDTLESFKAGPGTDYMSVRMKRASDGGGRLDVYLLWVNVTNPYITCEQQLGTGKLLGTEKPTALAQRLTTDTKVYFAGTNGDFYATTGDVGLPIGLTIGNFEYAYIGHPHYKVGVIKEDGRPEIADWMPAPNQTWVHTAHLVVGTDTFPINHINYKRNENELVLYNYHQGATTGTNEYGSEAVLSLLPGERWATNGTMKAMVETVSANAGNTALTTTKFVLSGHGTMKNVIESLQTGDEVEIVYSLFINNRYLNVAQCISGHQTNLMVNNGQVVTENFWDELHPRTGYGYSQTGDSVILCVVDGRGLSVGCNTQVLGAIMRHYGAWYALNWDGGGSSNMYLQQFGQMNRGSDGTERSVTNCFFAVANLPEKDETISEILAYSPTLLLPKYGKHQPKFLGYNKYGVLLDTDVQGVTLTTDETAGYIEDGAFVCMGDGAFTAHYGDVTTTVQVRVKEDAEVSMRLDSVLVSDDTDYPIEIVGVVGKNEVLLQPSALSWTIEDPTVCAISAKGCLSGLQDGGRTRVIGRLGDFSDTLIVNVEIPEHKSMLLTDMSNAEELFVIKTTPSSLKTEMRTAENGKGMLWTNFTGGRAANTKFTFEKAFYSLPRFVEIRYTTEAFPISKIAFEFQANNTIEKMNHTLEADQLTLNGSASIMLNLDSILGVKNDIAVYPVRWNYMTFFYDLKAEKKEYEILFDGIYLHYGNISVGIDNVTMSSFNVYPNPVVDGMLTITNASAEVAYLYDVQGRLMTQTAVRDAAAQLHVANLPAGTYLLSIGNETVKIIKK